MSQDFFSPQSLLTSSSCFKLGQNRTMFHGGQQHVTRRAFEAKLAQRALTLVGGGLNKPIATPTKDMTQTKPNHARKSSPFPGYVSHRQQKRNRMDVRVREGKRPHAKDCPNTCITDYELLVLTQLHQLWKEYFHSLRRTQIGLDDLELVGAHVRIVQCKEQSSWIGSEGLIVVDTANTWQVVMGLPQDSETEEVSLETRSNKLFLQKFTRARLIRIPKQGSKIALILNTT
jgi:hypothetical protein